MSGRDLPPLVPRSEFYPAAGHRRDSSQARHYLLEATTSTLSPMEVSLGSLSSSRIASPLVNVNASIFPFPDPESHLKAHRRITSADVRKFEKRAEEASEHAEETTQKVALLSSTAKRDMEAQLHRYRVQYGLKLPPLELLPPVAEDPNAPPVVESRSCEIALDLAAKEKELWSQHYALQGLRTTAEEVSQYPQPLHQEDTTEADARFQEWWEGEMNRLHARDDTLKVSSLLDAPLPDGGLSPDVTARNHVGRRLPSHQATSSRKPPLPIPVPRPVQEYLQQQADNANSEPPRYSNMAPEPASTTRTGTELMGWVKGLVRFDSMVRVLDNGGARTVGGGCDDDEIDPSVRESVPRKDRSNGLNSTTSSFRGTTTHMTRVSTPAVGLIVNRLLRGVESRCNSPVSPKPTSVVPPQLIFGD